MTAMRLILYSTDRTYKKVLNMLSVFYHDNEEFPNINKVKRTDTEGYNGMDLVRSLNLFSIWIMD